jgi:hypothetical protein
MLRKEHKHRQREFENRVFRRIFTHGVMQWQKAGEICK